MNHPSYLLSASFTVAEKYKPPDPVATKVGGSTTQELGNQMKSFCYVISIHATAQWLALPRNERDAHWDAVREIVAKFSERVSFLYYDADAFHATHSDMVICEADDIRDYHHMWDQIKDTAIFCNGFYDITDVRMGLKGVSHGS